MLDKKALDSLVAKGRAIQEQTRSFIKSPTVAASQQLIVQIDELIERITPHLLNPSLTENTQVTVIINTLGRIVKNITAIKYSIKK
jgi:hypothetical protein